jgi:hypothetical protein
MILVCLDYLWRDLYASNARRIIDHANRLFFTERQTLDALFVLQANPKPEHSAIEGVDAAAGFGVSQVVIGGRHKLARIETPEFSTDDLGGAPVCRLRFGTGTRLYYFNLPLHHEVDPRSSRLPLKVHAILRHDGERWAKVAGERIAEYLALEPGRARG